MSSAKLHPTDCPMMQTFRPIFAPMSQYQAEMKLVPHLRWAMAIDSAGGLGTPCFEVFEDELQAL